MSLGGSNNELACVYAALILHDEGLEITSDKISAILKAASIETEAYWPTLFAKLCKGKDMGALISSVGAAGGGNHVGRCVVSAARSSEDSRSRVCGCRVGCVARSGQANHVGDQPEP